MKKFSIIFISLLLSASVLTSCTKPTIDGVIDTSNDQSVVDTDNGVSNGTENPGGGNSSENNNGNENNGGENNNSGNENNGGDGEVTPPPDLDEPEEASVYSGTPDTSWYNKNDVKSEYILTTADEVMGINQLRKDSEGAITFEGISIKLGADVVFNKGTMEDILSSNDNKTWVMVSSAYPFLGSFDGQGHTISGAYLKLGSSGVQGLFGSLGKNAEIKNLNVINTVVSGPTAEDKNTLGTLASKISGDDANVTISNVTVHSTVKEAGYKTTWVGGIVGIISDAGTLTMKNCNFYGSVTTSGRSAGGILGAALNTKATVNILNCENHGAITANCDAGGLIGTSAVKILNVESSENFGTVKAPTCQGDLFGYQSNAIDVRNGLRSEDTDLRVMSFNLQSNFDGFSEAGTNRMKAIKQEIYFYSPDIVAVQEDYSAVLAKFSLDGYSRIAPGTLSSGMSNCSIFYKTSSVTKKTGGSKYITSDGSKNTVALTAQDVRTGNYKLTAAELAEFKITSSTTNKGMRNLTTSASGTTKILGPKMITWGVFGVGNKDVIVVNVHLQHRSQNAAYSTPAVQKLRLMERLKQLYYVNEQVKTLKKTYTNAEVVILGDFNDLVGSQTYLELKEQYGYSSAHETAAERYGVSATWNNAFKVANQGNSYPSVADRSSNSMLDFCFISSGLKALKFRVGAGAAAISYQNLRYTSDHLPIITDIHFGTTVPAAKAPSVYSGTPDTSWYKEGTKTYTLTTADQFVGINKLRQDSNGSITFDGVTIKLGVDIIINEGTLESIKLKGNENKKLTMVDSSYEFKGIFDGQGHSISGVYISSSYSYRAIFGGVGGSAQIKNFILENSYFVASAKSYFGTIIGRINNTSANVSLTNITLADSVLVEQGATPANNVGGFVGALQKGKLTVSNCHFNGTVNFPDGEHIAGFVGQSAGGTTIVFNNCHGSGEVIAKDYVTGLSVYTDSTTKKNNGSCLTGTVKCVSGSNKNASYIK